MSSETPAGTCAPCITHWAEENIDELRVSAEAEAERLQSILAQIQSLQSLPPESKKQSIEKILESLQHTASKEDLQELLDALDAAVSEFMGDPRRFVAGIAQILSCFENSPERTDLAVQRFLQDKQIGQISSPAPFDWAVVDMLLSQLEHLWSADAVFTTEMKNSVVLSLFPKSGEGHFLQDLVSQFLTLSVGEQIGTVRKRMMALAQAPPSKVTLLSNMVIEIHEKYEKMDSTTQSE